MSESGLSKRYEILTGDALECLQMLASESVHCCITSPPFYGLRDYGTGKWLGGDAECKHKAGPQRAAKSTTHSPPHMGSEGIQREACGKCGAMRIDRQIGLE